MFSSKYIFETRRTRYWRYFQNTLFIFGLSLIFYSIFCLAFILVSKKSNESSQEAFFKRPPDLIVVYTGDLGRIPYAIKKAKEYKQSNIFITGVYSKNSVESLLKPLGVSEQLDRKLLNIDYLARNTVENVISTYRHLRMRKGIKRVLIISHDYHIMRIKLIINKLKTSQDKYDFYYSGVETDYSKWRSIKILYKEVFKLVRTWGFLSLWDPTSPHMELNSVN
jgi:uncharacterized SAM-binding protein YcdF (DUF218 family)